jgi:FkbM family methyltransferase
MKHFKIRLRLKLEDISFKYKLIKRKVVIRKKSFSVYAWHPRKWNLQDSPPLSWMLDSISDDDVVYDIGANRGYYALSILTMHCKAQVFAFEPNPVIFKRLKKNIELNGWTDRAHLFSLAVGEKEGNLKFNITLSDSASSFDPKRAQLAGWEIVSSKESLMKSLDSILQEFHLPPPKHIKIDTEGYEIPILLGANVILKEFHPKLYLEAHPLNINDDTIAGLRKILNKYNYDIRQEGRFLFCI